MNLNKFFRLSAIVDWSSAIRISYMGFTIVEALTLAAVGRDYTGCHKYVPFA
jgi:hypothetical protein